MATPTKGAVIRMLDSVVTRLTGRSEASAPISPTATTDVVAERAPATQRIGASPAETDAAFNPPNSWFPPGRPLAPFAPAGSTTGRQFDYAPYTNVVFLPRSESGENAIDFPTLRRMSDPAQGGLDLLRLAIETRKDQMAAQRFLVRGQDKDDDGGDDAIEIMELLKRPDGVHTFRQWKRMLLEDHFVLDATAVYFAKHSIARNEERPLFEPIDGATLKLLVTAQGGRTPLPPLPAFQQVLKGVPTENYTLDQIGYYAFNLRTNKMYGMSRVEQVLATVGIALNRQYQQLAYFTDGTVPDGFMEVPKTWSLDEITRFTDWFNSELSGQIAERRKIRFVPADAKYTGTKTEVLKDTFDEWLARLVCYCFSLSPQALVREVNRATAQTAKQTAQEEGLEPVKLWFKDAVDDMLARIGAGHLAMWWSDEEIVDPEAKARVTISLFGGTAGSSKQIVTLAEAREMSGLPPATDDQLLELQPPKPEPTVVDASQNGKAGQHGNGNGAPASSSNGKGAAHDEGVTAKTPRSRVFGYDRVDDIAHTQRVQRSEILKTLDAMKAALNDQLQRVESRVEKLAARPEPAPQSVHVEAAAAPAAPQVTVPVNVEVHLPTPTTRGPVTLHAERTQDGGGVIVREQRDTPTKD